MFRTYAEWLENHPIIRKFATDVDQRRFRRRLPADDFAAVERKRDEPLAEPVERWQAVGSLRDDVSPMAIVGLLEPLRPLAVKTDEDDATYYSKRDFVIETFARGLEPK